MRLIEAIIHLHKIGGQLAFWFEENDTKLVVKLRDSTRVELLEYWVDEMAVEPAAYDEIIAQQIERFVAEW